MTQDSQNSGTIAQPCPNCGASPQYREWSNYLNSNYMRISSEKHKVVGSTITPLVCTQCGYVQLFVNREDFRKG